MLIKSSYHLFGVYIITLCLYHHFEGIHHHFVCIYHFFCIYSSSLFCEYTSLCVFFISCVFHIQFLCRLNTLFYLQVFLTPLTSTGYTQNLLPAIIFSLLFQICMIYKKCLNTFTVFLPFPHLRMNGTPSHRSFITFKTAVTNVGVVEPGG